MRGSSFRGRGGFPRGGAGRGSFRGRGRGFGGGRGSSFNTGPPARVVPLGEFTHACEGVMVCKASCANCILINRPVFHENKDKIGVVDEVFGPINAYVNIEVLLNIGFCSQS